MASLLEKVRQSNESRQGSLRRSRPLFAIRRRAGGRALTNQIKNDTSRSGEGKCLWTANEGSEVLSPRCLPLYEKTLSSESNQFFSDPSLGVLIFFPLSSSFLLLSSCPGRQRFWKSTKRLFFLTFLTAIFATRLADNANQNNTKKCLPAEPSIICSAADPVLRRCHTITRSQHLCSRFLSRVIHSVSLSHPRPPAPRLSHPLHKLYSTYRPWVYVSRYFHWLHKLSWVVFFSVLCALNGLVRKKQNKNKKQQQLQIPELLTATHTLQNCWHFKSYESRTWGGYLC